MRDGGQWRLWGEKWFCSNVDADLAVLLARPDGARAGGRGLGLFLLPKTLPDGSRNAYRITRLKDKLGSRTMASGEIVFEGAVAWQLGELDRGLKQMLEMVNSSRVSHLTRAAGMMRRCLNEAMLASRQRNAFGKAVIEHPLMQRQLLKLMVPTEQALSALFHAASTTGRDDAHARAVLRILTPIYKYRACRDNVAVATGAMEARGGNGYIEDWPNARLVRDAHLGLIWEGTSNINSLDAVQRAVGKERAHLALRDDLNAAAWRGERSARTVPHAAGEHGGAGNHLRGGGRRASGIRALLPDRGGPAVPGDHGSAAGQRRRAHRRGWRRCSAAAAGTLRAGAPDAGCSRRPACRPSPGRTRRYPSCSTRHPYRSTRRRRCCRLNLGHNFPSYGRRPPSRHGRCKPPPSWSATVPTVVSRRWFPLSWPAKAGHPRLANTATA